MADDFDAIVVGAGMAGSSAAIRLAQGGANVLLVERGAEAGVKNLSGGVLWGRDLDRILPNWSQEMPVERHVVRKRFGLMTHDRSLVFEYSEDDWRRAPYVAHTVLRVRTDAWLAKKAEEAGATVVTGVPVERLNWEGTKVHGIVQGGETMTAPVTVLADGTNSRLSLGTPIRPASRLSGGSTELGIKEVYKLSESQVNERFNVGPGEGHAEEWLAGFLPPGVMGGGFLYTNRETVSVGLILNIASLFGKPVRTEELMERFKLHPAIAPRLDGAELVEYGAKLIPGGWASRPASFHGSGWLVVGDAAGFVFSNGIVIQGMNYAIRTGIEAADTALAAKKAGSASATQLAEYTRRLRSTSILADFKDFARMDHLKWNPRLYATYPAFATELFHRLMSEGGGPKRPIREHVEGARRKSKASLYHLAMDGVSLLRDF
jgi:electron transfer flavoprotein-quinone oxidoreductase